MDKQSNRLLAACSVIAVMTLTTIATLEPAQAQFGGIAGMLLGRMGGGFHYSPGRGGCDRRCRSHRSKSDDNTDSSEPSSRKERNDRVLASLAPPRKEVQIGVLKSVIVSKAVNEVGTTKDLKVVGKTVSNDDDRDWVTRVDEIMRKLRKKADEGKASVPGDISEHALEQSLDASMKRFNLDRFESFLGENWSSERLRVKVLVRVNADLDHLLDGNTRGIATLQQLTSLIDSAAQATYRRMFEVSELLASNRSSAQFVQRLYQTHGDVVDEHLREVADRMLTRAAANAIGKYEIGLRQDENGFALRYRAQRIVFDCLAENIVGISSGETTIASVGEIEYKLEATGKNECVSWLDHQFGGNSRSLQKQQPMPVRVVWSAEGPKEDPSMYGRATGGF